MRGITRRFSTSTSIRRLNMPMLRAWTATLRSNHFFGKSATSQERICAPYKPPGSSWSGGASLGKARPGKHCQKHPHILWRLSLCRHPLRHHQEERRAANFHLPAAIQQVYHHVERRATAQPAWQRFRRIRYTTCGRSPSTPTQGRSTSPSGISSHRSS